MEGGGVTDENGGGRKRGVRTPDLDTAMQNVGLHTLILV